MRQFKQFHILQRRVLSLLMLLLLMRAAPAQNLHKQLDALQQAFASFEYHKVIQMADQILDSTKNIPLNQRIEILRMKAIAHYVLDQNELATLSFIEILKLKPDYTLDPLTNSPKIIRFFETIRKNYLKNRPPQKNVPKPSTRQPSVDLKRLQSERKAILKSVIWPGLGHYSIGQKSKGSFLMLGSLVGATGCGYLIWRSNVLEERYLNAIEQKDIDRKFEAYNKIYRWRNAALIGYGLLWLYAQFDLSQKLFKTDRLTLQLQSLPASGRQYGLSFCYRF